MPEAIRTLNENKSTYKLQSVARHTGLHKVFVYKMNHEIYWKFVNWKLCHSNEAAPYLVHKNPWVSQEILFKYYL